ncbi:hypothetical protein HK099_000227 [Clydaea vesicula]|uniref:GATA-type domain-containing protein n=1 Tax=Clydaea vesicula TaxID=447962 RepID=A0AAD5U5T6_9FUNG|nr:hypothetical protein HK099_000227 [Clydaea vesicula]
MSNSSKKSNSKQTYNSVLAVSLAQSRKLYSSSLFERFKGQANTDQKLTLLSTATLLIGPHQFPDTKFFKLTTTPLDLINIPGKIELSNPPPHFQPIIVKNTPEINNETTDSNSEKKKSIAVTATTLVGTTPMAKLSSPKSSLTSPIPSQSPSPASTPKAQLNQISQQNFNQQDIQNQQRIYYSTYQNGSYQQLAESNLNSFTPQRFVPPFAYNQSMLSANGLFSMKLLFIYLIGYGMYSPFTPGYRSGMIPMRPIMQKSNVIPKKAKLSNEILFQFKNDSELFKFPRECIIEKETILEPFDLILFCYLPTSVPQPVSFASSSASGVAIKKPKFQQGLVLNIRMCNEVLWKSLQEFCLDPEPEAVQNLLAPGSKTRRSTYIKKDKTFKKKKDRAGKPEKESETVQSNTANEEHSINPDHLEQVSSGGDAATSGAKSPGVDESELETPNKEENEIETPNNEEYETETPNNEESEAVTPNELSAVSSPMNREKETETQFNDDEDERDEDEKEADGLKGCYEAKGKLSKNVPVKRENSRNNHNSGVNISNSPKVCENCGTKTTPMWRRGPSGFSSLCNACGVKWMNGKLIMHSVDAQTEVDKKKRKNFFSEEQEREILESRKDEMDEECSEEKDKNKKEMRVGPLKKRKWGKKN